MVLGATVLLAEGFEFGENSYQVNTVSRDTVWQYRAGREVYELTNPDGQRFRMQSFTRAIGTDQLLGELASLGSHLNLPEGWSFATRRLTEDLELPTVAGIAEVITDDFGNTYQRVPDGLEQQRKTESTLPQSAQTQNPIWKCRQHRGFRHASYLLKLFFRKPNCCRHKVHHSRAFLAGSLSSALGVQY